MNTYHSKGVFLQVLRVSPSWRAQKMIRVGRVVRVKDPKYKRCYKKTYARLAHYQESETPVVGDRVWVVPCRPISALKRHRAWLRKQ